MFKCCEEFVNRMGTKCVANIGAIKGDADSAVLNRSVVGDIGEIESRHDTPSRWIEDVRNFALAHGPILSDEKAKHPLVGSL